MNYPKDQQFKRFVRQYQPTKRSHQILASLIIKQLQEANETINKAVEEIKKLPDEELIF